MEIHNFSKNYRIKKLTENDIDELLLFCQDNTIYYHYHPVNITKELLIQYLFEIPQNKSYEDKYFVGFYQEHHFIALLDLIDGYPQDQMAYIGLFMINMKFQGEGRGTSIINVLINYLKKAGYKKIRLGIDKGNPQSDAFWSKFYFKKTGEEVKDGIYTYLPMELNL